MARPLPPLDDVIDGARAMCLNMPAGTNPALARAVGALLKQVWLRTLLRRLAEMQRRQGLTFRPAMFLCDEYQTFAMVGEDDPAGDEKMFALTRRARLIESRAASARARCAASAASHGSIRATSPWLATAGPSRT